MGVVYNEEYDVIWYHRISDAKNEVPHKMQSLEKGFDCSLNKLTEITSKSYVIAYNNVGTAVAQWLRRCATNRKVAGSIPDGAIGNYH